MIFNDICKSYHGVALFDHFSFEVKTGSITAILGENGAGKTTLLNIAAGLTDYSGTCDASSVSYVFQDTQLFPNLSVEENIQIVLKKEQWPQIPEILLKVGLAGYEKRFPNSLSGGEKKRVSIARAFLFPHEILLMDEPFASLDLSTKYNLIALTANLWSQKKDTILLVSHDIHEVALLSQYIMVLRKGKILSELENRIQYPRCPSEKYPVESLCENILLKN